MDFYGTLGDACWDRDCLVRLFQAGMTGVRLNLSHTTLRECSESLRQCYWKAASEAGVSPRLIVDLQGPELRVGVLGRPVHLVEQEEILLGKDGIPVPEQVCQAVRKGHHISLDDSALLLEVTEPGNRVRCRVLRGGVLESRKSLAVLGVEIHAPTLTAQDVENLRQGAELGVTDVLQPFVRGREDILTLRRTLRDCGLEQARIMAKIENQRGMEHLEEIVQEADVICIARGDLGNSMPLWELPTAQKKIAKYCREQGRSFFVVTQMLWSMGERAVPTRAEVSDIYNAVLDGADALMLTGETAVGKYPVQAMEYLVKTARCAKRDIALG